MKSDISRMEREITIKIQENQMKQKGMEDSEQASNHETKTPVIQMNAKESMPMKVVVADSNSSNNRQYQVAGIHRESPLIRKTKRLRL